MCKPNTLLYVFLLEESLGKVQKLTFNIPRNFLNIMKQTSVIGTFDWVMCSKRPLAPAGDYQVYKCKQHLLCMDNALITWLYNDRNTGDAVTR